MNDTINYAHAALAGVITAVGAMWGKLGWLFVLWALCMALDYLTGSLAAMKKGEWSSDRAREGLWQAVADEVITAAEYEEITGEPY